MTTNWLKRLWTKREPVYSEVGEALYKSLTEWEAEWINTNLLYFQNPSKNIELQGWVGLRSDTWFFQSAIGVVIKSLVGGKEANSVLTWDDHERLYNTLASIADRQTRAKWVEKETEGTLWIREALGLEASK
jgi:hypothetical protein